MKKKIISLILKIKNKLPEEYHFYFIGFVSYFYLFLYYLKSKINLAYHTKKYKDIINEINSSDRDIFVFLPSTDWNDIKQRPQHLAKAFVNKGHIVIFLTKNQTLDSVEGIESYGENFYLCSNFLLVNHIKDANLFFIGPSNYPLLKYFKNYQNIIYDFPDELDFFPGLSKGIVKKYHLNLIKISKLVTPSASFLESVIKNDCPDARTKIILNGVFPDDFKLDLLTSGTEVDIEMSNYIKKGKKVVGFYGGLGEKWIDFSLIKFLVENRKEYIFIIIGSGNIDYLVKKYRFSENKNVFFLGPKKYEKLKYYAKYFDIALIPFLINDFTLGVSPVKSFEYMVQGIPFVSTALPECRKYKNVLIGEDYDDFIAKIDIGIELKNNLDYVTRLKQEGINNTWQSRAELIVNFLK